MKNIVPSTINGVTNSADLIKGGLIKHKDVLKLHYSDVETVEARRAAFVLANGNYEVAKFAFAEQQAVMTSLTKRARSLAMIVRELLKPIFGARYARVWDGVGFKKNSLETPRSFVELKELIFQMSQHLATYTTEENPPLAYMAGKAVILAEEMKVAFVRGNSLDAEMQQLLVVRTDAMKELRRYLRVVIDELHLVLDPMDRRWEAFGLNRPGAKEAPDVPEAVEIKVVENKRAEIKWAKPARAEYFRVWMQIRGVDAEPRTIGSPTDLDFMVEELPANATMDFFVSAMNGGGESGLSEPVTITTV